MIETRRTTFTRLEIAFSGVVDARDVRRALDALGTALDGEASRATLLVDLAAAEDVAMKAGGELASGAGLLARLGRLERVGVVGDASWTRSLARLREALPARLQVRFFRAGERDAARAWIAGGAAGSDAVDGLVADEGSAGPSGGGPADAGTRREARDAPPALRLIDEGGGLHVLEIEGRIRRADVEAMATRLDGIGTGAERVRLLGRVVRFEGFEPAVMLSPALWRLQREGLGRVSRFALVSSVEWLGRILESTGRLQGVEVRSFAPDAEADARAWLGDGAGAPRPPDD